MQPEEGMVLDAGLPQVLTRAVTHHVEPDQIVHVIILKYTATYNARVMVYFHCRTLSNSDSDTSFVYYADTMGKGSESESESVETCSA